MEPVSGRQEFAPVRRARNFFRYIRHAIRVAGLEYRKWWARRKARGMHYDETERLAHLAALIEKFRKQTIGEPKWIPDKNTMISQPK
jgi:hypothetical protein